MSIGFESLDLTHCVCLPLFAFGVALYVKNRNHIFRIARINGRVVAVCGTAPHDANTCIVRVEYRLPGEDVRMAAHELELVVTRGRTTYHTDDPSDIPNRFPIRLLRGRTERSAVYDPLDPVGSMSASCDDSRPVGVFLALRSGITMLFEWLKFWFGYVQTPRCTERGMHCSL